MLDAYNREGGVWLDHAPVLVNEDFNFALALSLENGVGAGLAAAQRKQSNQTKAGRFRDVTLPSVAMERMALLTCKGIYVYFLAWGVDSLALKMIVDVQGDVTKSYVVQGPELDAASAGSDLSQQLTQLLDALHADELPQSN